VYKTILELPYFAVARPAIASTPTTPSATQKSAVPSAEFERFKELLKSGILVTKDPTIKPLIKKADVTALQTRRVTFLSNSSLIG
jgi:hypothetical protein